MGRAPTSLLKDLSQVKTVGEDRFLLFVLHSVRKSRWLRKGSLALPLQ